MSHITKRNARATDLPIVREACRRSGAQFLGLGSAGIYNSTATGIVVKLDGWRFPIVINPTTGEISYDNYQGYWGDIAELNRFLQDYGVAAVQQQALQDNRPCTTEQLANGDVRCVITLDGEVTQEPVPGELVEGWGF